jgi:hypothetical protein
MRSASGCSDNLLCRRPTFRAGCACGKEAGLETVVGRRSLAPIANTIAALANTITATKATFFSRFNLSLNRKPFRLCVLDFMTGFMTSASFLNWRVVGCDALDSLQSRANPSCELRKSKIFALDRRGRSEQVAPKGPASDRCNTYLQTGRPSGIAPPRIAPPRIAPRRIAPPQDCTSTDSPSPGLHLDGSRLDVSFTLRSITFRSTERIPFTAFVSPYA